MILFLLSYIEVPSALEIRIDQTLYIMLFISTYFVSKANLYINNSASLLNLAAVISILLPPCRDTWLLLFLDTSLL